MAEIEDKSHEQEDAEAEVESFRKDLGPFVIAAERTRMAMLFTNAREPDNPIIFANEAFLNLTKFDREEVLGQSFNSLISRGTTDEEWAQIEAAFEHHSEHESEICYHRKDGSNFWAALFISPVQDASGDVVQHFASFVDISEYKREYGQSRMLIDELNHRVKNTLSTVQSIVWQASRNASDPETIRESIESRLFALSRSHDLLTRENWASAGLRDLIDDAMEPFGVTDGRAERIVVTGENIRVSPKAALSLGIAFHELATNAVKYGSLSNDTGSLLISATIEPAPDKRLILRWQEKDGPSVSPPSKKGFGSWVIERGLAHELEGTVNLEYRPEGVVCTINVPAPQSRL